MRLNYNCYVVIAKRVAQNFCKNKLSDKLFAKLKVKNVLPFFLFKESYKLYPNNSVKKRLRCRHCFTLIL